MDEYIYNEADGLFLKYGTRNPFVLLDCIGAVVTIVDTFDANGLKGFCTILNRTKFVVINGKLHEYEQRLVAGHELGHLVIHEHEIQSSPNQTLKDFNLYDNSGRIEYQANLFAADYMLDDNLVIELVQNEHMDFFSVAKELYTSPHLLGFKLFSMAKRGYNVRTPISLNSKFLK